jgi:hypothetical protein
MDAEDLPHRLLNSLRGRGRELVDDGRADRNLRVFVSPCGSVVRIPDPGSRIPNPDPGSRC